MKDQNPEDYRVSVEPNREWISQTSEDDGSLSISFMTPCSRYDDEISDTTGKLEEKTKSCVPNSFIPESFDPYFIHGKHSCVVCDAFPIIGYRLHYECFKPNEGCCYSCFNELFLSGSKEKRQKWLSSFIPVQLDSDVYLQDRYRAQFPLLAGTSRDDEKSLIKVKVQNIASTLENNLSFDKDTLLNYSESKHAYFPNDKDPFQGGSHDKDDSVQGKSFETFFSDEDFTAKEDDIKVHLCTQSDDENIQTQKDVFIAFDSDNNNEDEASLNHARNNPSFVVGDSFEVVISDKSFQIHDTSVHDLSKGFFLLTQPLFESLLCFLPEELSRCKIWLNYSLQRDGASLHTLTQNTWSSPTTLMIIQTSNGDVLGCYTSAPWKFDTGYYGCGSSFVWRMRHKRSTSYPVGIENLKSEEKLQVFPNSDSDLCVQFCSEDMLGIGKGCGHDKDIEIDCREYNEATEQRGFAILLYGDLQHGRTSPTASFRNPRLIDNKDGNFEVYNIEVWSFASTFSLEAEVEIEPNQISMLRSELFLLDRDVFGLNDRSTKPFIAVVKDISINSDGLPFSQLEDSEVRETQLDWSNSVASHAQINQNSLVDKNDLETCPAHHLEESSNLSLFCCDDILAGKVKRKNASHQTAESDRIDHENDDIAQTLNDSSFSLTPEFYTINPSHELVEDSTSHDVDQTLHNGQTFTNQALGSPFQSPMLPSPEQEEHVTTQSNMGIKAPCKSVENKNQDSNVQSAIPSSCGLGNVIGHGTVTRGLLSITLPEKIVSESRSEDRIDEALANPLWLQVMPNHGLGLKNNSITLHQIKALQAFFFQIQNIPIEVLKLNRHNVWQKRVLTVSKEVGPIQYFDEQRVVSSTIPLALLWVKKRSINNMHSISSMEKQGRGGILLNELIFVEIQSHSETTKNALLTKKQIQMNMVALSVNSESNSIIFCMDRTVATEFAIHCNAIINIFGTDVKNFVSQKNRVTNQKEFQMSSTPGTHRNPQDTAHHSSQTKSSPDEATYYPTSRDISSSFSDDTINVIMPRGQFQDPCNTDDPQLLNEIKINHKDIRNLNETCITNRNDALFLSSVSESKQLKTENGRSNGHESAVDKEQIGKDSDVLVKALEILSASERIEAATNAIENVEITLIESNYNKASDEAHAASKPTFNHSQCIHETVKTGIQLEEEVNILEEKRLLITELENEVYRLNKAVDQLTKEKVSSEASFERMSSLKAHLESQVNGLRSDLSNSQDEKFKVDRNLRMFKESFMEELTCAIELQKELENALEDKQSEVSNLLNLIEVERALFRETSFRLKESLKRKEHDIGVERENILLLQSKLNSLELEKLNLEGTANDLQTELQKYVVTEESMQTDTTKLRTISEQHKHEIQYLTSRLKRISEESDTKIDQAREQMQTAHDVAMQKLQDELISQKEAEVNVAVEGVRAECRRLQEESNNAFAITLEEIRTEALASEAKLGLSLREEYESRLLAMEASHKDEVRRMEEEYSGKLQSVQDEMQTAHDVAMQKLQDELISQKEAEVNVAVEGVRAECRRLQEESNNTFAVTLEEMRTEALASEAKLGLSLREEYESRLLAMEASHQDEVRRMEEEYSGKLQSVQDEMQTAHDVATQKLQDELISQKEAEVNVAVEGVRAECRRLQEESNNTFAVTLEEMRTEALASKAKVIASHEVKPKSRFWVWLLLILLPISYGIFFKLSLTFRRYSENSFIPPELTHDRFHTADRSDMGFLDSDENERNLSYLDCKRRNSSDQPIAFIKKQSAPKDLPNAKIPSIDITNHELEKHILSKYFLNGYVGTIENEVSRLAGSDRNRAASVLDGRNQKLKMKGFTNVFLDTLLIASDNVHNPYSIGL